MGSSFQKIRGVLVFCSLLQSGLNWQWENSACPTAEVNGASVYYEAAHRPFQRLGSAAFRYCHDSRTPAISMCHAGGWYPPIDGCGQGVSEISKVTCRKLAVHKGPCEQYFNIEK
ncbi:hypothetical protein AB6A40_009401 [Gnathostoma spinigerum]|uniref:Sushi domain-containing protein n=1 Tax=Gnathostoma spinigerum TaxID=75299 RepID=A0ABD6EUA4_9BILA